MTEGTIKCDKCGLEFLTDFKKEKTIHEAECSGKKDPKMRFCTGDIVVIGALGQYRLGRNGVYEVVSLQTDPNHTLRVRDRITGTTTTFAQSFLVKIGHNKVNE